VEAVQECEAKDEPLEVPLLTDQLLLFSPLTRGGQPSIGRDSVLALSRFVPSTKEGGAERGPGRAAQTFLRAVFHASHADRMRRLLSRDYHLQLLGTVLAHRRALRGMANTRLSRSLRTAILAHPGASTTIAKANAPTLAPIQGENVPPEGASVMSSSLAALDDSQRQACASICDSSLPVVLVHGPPGTGKTRTLVRAILELVASGRRVLACAPTNVALLHLATSLAKQAAADVAESTVLVVDEARLTHNGGQVPGCLQSMLLGSKLGARDGPQISMKGYRERAVDVVACSRLVFATVATSGRSEMVMAAARTEGFDVAVLDEASQVLEAHTLTVLQLRPTRLVLAGDPCQLPAVVKSALSRKGVLARSLMERLILLSRRQREGGALQASGWRVPVCHLMTQYRMHPQISAFPHRTFYRGDVGQLRDGVDDVTACAPWHDGDRFPPYAFLHFGGQEQRAGGCSTSNVSEAMVVVALLSSFLRQQPADQRPSSIAIITPYKAQVAALQAVLEQRCPFYRASTEGPGLISVRTVDGFQGQEVDLVIISATRSNEDGAVGFLRDERRLNVAITRARRSLWIVGDADTLTGGEGGAGAETWARLIEDAKARHAFVSIDNVVTAEARGWLGNAGVAAKAVALRGGSGGSRLTLEAVNRIFAASPWHIDISHEFLKNVEQAFLGDKRGQAQRSMKGSKGVQLGKGLESLLTVVGRLARGDAFSKAYKGSRLMQLKVSGTEYAVVASVLLDEQRLRQVVKVWKLLNTREGDHKGIGPVLRVLKQKAARQPWFDEACAVWWEDPATGRRHPKMWTSLEAMRRGLEEVTSGPTVDLAADETPDQGEDGEEALLLSKAYRLTAVRLYNVLQYGSEAVDLKLRLTGSQIEAMHELESAIVVGRSGTGRCPFPVHSVRDHYYKSVATHVMSLFIACMAALQARRPWPSAEHCWSRSG
jgi:hypothetical protein